VTTWNVPLPESGEGVRILVDGKLLPTIETPRIWTYHKPRGEIVTRDDPLRRRTVWDSLPGDLQGLFKIGRLDFQSEGLLLLTNCGHLARKLELPASAISRRYEVLTDGLLSEAAVTDLRRGVLVEGMQYRPMVLERGQLVSRRREWVEVTLTEGKNREIRKLFDHFGVDVDRLKVASLFHNKYTHIHTHTHTYTHTYTHTHRHVNTHTHTHTHTHICARARAHTHTQTHTHTHTHTHTLTHTHTHIHTHTHTYLFLTHIRTHSLVHRHPHYHVHTQTRP
jgi:pseudouridine synthase